MGLWLVFLAYMQRAIDFFKRKLMWEIVSDSGKVGRHFEVHN